MAGSGSRDRSALLCFGVARTDELLRALGELGYQPSRASRAALTRRVTYYDTWNGELRRRGRHLRKDEGRDKWELLADGALIAAATGAERPGSVPHGLEERLAGLVRGNPFIPHLTLEVSRSRVRVTAPSARPMLLEVSELEPRSVHLPGATARCLIVEAEDGADPDSAYVLSLLRGRLGGTMTDPEPLEAGLRALGLPLPGAGVPARLAVKKGDTAGEVAAKVLSAQLHRLLSAVAGAVQDLDPEYVHEMRVAARTLRQALRLFRPFLGAEAVSHATEELRWVGQKLGELRDQDVFLSSLRRELPEMVPERAAREQLLAIVARARAGALGELREALSSARYAALLSALESLAGEARKGGRSAAAGPARRAGERAIRKALGRIGIAEGRRAQTLDRDELHAMRIRFRRLRYACEIYRPVFGRRMRRALELVVAFQDCLGEHQDAIVARERLLTLAREAAGAGGRLRKVTEAVENLAERKRRALGRLKARFVELWESFPELQRRLERCLERGGSEA